MRREFGEGGVDPPLQRIAAEILLHDHVGVAAHVEPGEPGFEKLVQRGLANADRRVGPDGAEGEVRRYLVGGHRADVREPERLGVAAHEVESTLVDVECPDPCVRRLHRERERDRAPAATDVEEVAAGRGIGRVRQKNLGALVEVTGAENTARGRDVDLAAGEGDADLTEFFGARGLGTEIVIRHEGRV